MLLPAQGIYAVSAEREDVVSKGMAVIRGTEAGTDEVLINISENSEIYEGFISTKYFHKKIHGSVTFNDPRSSFSLSAAINEISELIY